MDDRVILLDDLQESRVFYQCKRTLLCSDNKAFRDVIDDCWMAFNNSAIDPNKDLLLIAIGRFHNSIGGFQELLKVASNFDNSATFINHLETKGATPQNSRDVFSVVQEVVEKRHGTVGQEKLWLFLKHIRVVWYDFEGNSEAKNNCINVLRNSYGKNLNQSSSLYDKLCQISEDLNSTSGSIDRDELIKLVIDLIPSIQETANTGLLMLEQYLQRNEIKPLVDNTFLNREEELALIEKFVINPQKRILLISGHGGVGKSTLSIESAKRYHAIKEFCFLQPITDVSSLSFPDNSVLIIDDAGNCLELAKIIDQVLNSITGRPKLILIDNTVFRDCLFYVIKQKKYEPDELEVKSGNISGFLKIKFPDIEPEIRNKITSECKGSFDYAIMLARYYGETKSMGSLQDAVQWKIAKYINSMKQRTKATEDELIRLVHLMSCIQPINLNSDRGALIATLGQNKYNLIEDLLLQSQDTDPELFTYIEDTQQYLIKPDPISDIIRERPTDYGSNKNLIERIFSFMPHRITTNILRLLGYEGIDKGQIGKIVVNFWNKMNKTIGSNQEYFLASSITCCKYFFNSISSNSNDVSVVILAISLRSEIFLTAL